MADIEIEGWLRPSGIVVMRALVGEVVSVWVEAEVRSSGTPLGEFFRFARVLSVRERIETRHFCGHCGEYANIALVVDWESEFTEAKSNEVCEGCVSGRVTAGGDEITFAGRV